MFPAFTREFGANTREFPAFTREFGANTREFPAFTLEFGANTREFPAFSREFRAILVSFRLLLVNFELMLVSFRLLLVNFEQTKKHGVRREFLHHALFLLLFTMHLEFKEEFIVTGQVFLPKVFVHFQFLRQFR